MSQRRGDAGKRERERREEGGGREGGGKGNERVEENVSQSWEKELDGAQNIRSAMRYRE